jgi:cell division protein FtsB
LGKGYRPRTALTRQLWGILGGRQDRDRELADQIPPRLPFGVLRPRPLLVASLVVALAVAGYTVLAPSALPKLVHQRQQNERLEADLARQRSRNTELEAEVSALQATGAGASAVVEEAARRELGFVKRDEIVLVGLPVPDASGARP